MPVKTILLGLLLSFAVIYPQTDIPISSAEKFNKRGFYSNESATLDGNEIISDYDGNLMMQYSTKLDFGNELSGDFTVIYNANVEHRAFNYYLSGVTKPNQQGYIINHPEWILGFKGIALQTLNFENNLYISKRNDSGTIPLDGSDVPLLIPGYTYTNYKDVSNFTVASGLYDMITILNADGSKIILKNTNEKVFEGIYEPLSLDNKGYAIVSNNAPQTNQRTMWYMPGDGLVYKFIEEPARFYNLSSYISSYPGGNSRFDYPHTMYLTEISDQLGGEVTFTYGASLTSGYGRKILSGIKYNRASAVMGETLAIEMIYDYNTSNGRMDAISIVNNIADDKITLVIDPNGISNLFSSSQSYLTKKILTAASIEDNLGRTNSMTYASHMREYWFKNTSQGFDGHIEYHANLMETINYYTGKVTSFEFYDNTFNGSVNSYVNLSAADLIQYSANVNIASRDCWTNFMVKNRTTYNKISGDNYNPYIIKKEDYFYNKTKTASGSLGGVRCDGIQTEIDEYIHNGSQLIANKKTVKEFAQYKTSIKDKDVADKVYTVKLISEKVEDAADIVNVSSSYDYEIGVIQNASDEANSYYDGSFELKSVSRFKNGPNLVQYTSTNSIITTEKLNFTGNKKNIIKVLRQTDPQGRITETAYKNFLPTQFTSADFYKIGSVAEEKIYSGSSILKDVLNTYDETAFKGQILTSVSNNQTTRKVTTSYEYVSANSFYKGFLSKITQNNKTATYEYSPTIIGGTASGKILKTDGTVIDGTFIHKELQLKPVKTTITSPEGSFITTSYFNKKGNPDFEIDINGYYNEYLYDELGRLTSVSLPGSFRENFGIYSSYCFLPSINFEYDNNGSMEYYFFFDKPIGLTNYTSADIMKGAFVLDFQNTVTSTINPIEVKISGVMSSYSGEKTYIGYSEITITLNPSYNYTRSQIAFSINNILSYFKKNNYSLCGLKFQFKEKQIVQQVVQSTSLNTTAAVLSSQAVIDAFYGKPMLTFISAFSPQPPTIGYIITNADLLSVKNTLISYDDNSSNPDIIEVSNRLNNTSASQEIVSKFDLDAFKQPYKSYVNNDAGTWELKSEKHYDAVGKLVKETDGMGISKTYTYDYLSRPLTVKLSGQTAQQTYAYSVGEGTIGGKTYYEKTVFTDEMSRTKTSYYDKVGNLVAEQLGTNAPTLYTYNSIYQLQNVKTPAGKYTYYTYDELGSLASKSSPDEGMYKYKYDKYGNLRFKYHATTNDLTFYVYDSFNRLVATGVKAAFDPDGFDSLNPDIYPNSIIAESSQTSWVVKNQYDAYNTTGNFTSAPALTINDGNFKGKLAATGFRDKIANAWSYKVYNYDALGRVNTFYQKFENWAVRNIASKYDNLGNLIFQNIDNGKFYTWYKFDNQGRLIKSLSNTANSEATANTDVKYSYNLADQAVGMSYYSEATKVDTFKNTYNANGWLWEIIRSNSYFRETLTYDPNGNIKGQTIANVVNSWPALSFTYGYDGYNRLTSSTCSNTAFSETYSYNADGAFTSKVRSGLNIGYVYPTTSNKLSSITVNGSALGFSYDAKGNLLSNGYKSVTLANYDHRNLPLTSSVSGGSSTTYYYDDNGNRIYKYMSAANREFYLRDHNGRELVIFDSATGKIKFINLYGIGLIGRAEIY